MSKEGGTAQPGLGLTEEFLVARLQEGRQLREHLQRRQAEFARRQAELQQQAERQEAEFERELQERQQQLQEEALQQKQRIERTRLELAQRIEALQQSGRESQSLRQQYGATLPERLASPLPAIQMRTTDLSSTSPSYPLNEYLHPGSVRLWEHVIPDYPNSGSLKAAVIGFQTAPPYPGKVNACVGKFLPPCKLWDDQRQPLDLVKLCQAPPSQQSTATDVVTCVHQLYTHLATHCILYGYISNWRYTRLARLVPYQTEQWPWHGDLYLSDPIAHTDHHTAQQPCMTAIGAVSWQHYQAVQAIATLPLPSERRTLPLPQPASGSNAAEEPEEPSRHKRSRHTTDVAQGGCTGDHGVHPGSDDHDQDADEGAQSHKRQASSAPDPAISTQPAATAKQQAYSLPTPRLLRLERHICYGCHGSVLQGVCDGVPAVIKLLGPSSEGFDAMQREQNALFCLAEANVKAAARLLGVGHLYLGVHFVATELIVGQPLTKVKPLSEDIAAAAVRALAEVHSAHPCLLHGSIRLRHVMLVAQPSVASAASSSSDVSTTPVCRVVDFGRATFKGSPAAQ